MTEDRWEAAAAIAAGFLVLFTAMINPLLSAGLALAGLLVLILLQFSGTRSGH